MSSITLAQARQKFSDSLKSQRSDNTLLTYNKALETFVNMLRDRHLDASSFPVAELNEDFLVDFVVHIKHLSPSTESLYLQVVKNFFEFLNAERLNDLNVSRVRMIIRQRTRRLRAVASEYPEEKIKLLIDSMVKLAEGSTTENNRSDRMLLLRDKRDGALILVLSDTGLRVDEVCRLRIGDIRWDEKLAIIPGRGGKQGIARISTRAINALEGYLDSRRTLDFDTGHERIQQPLFARHDKGVGKKIKPVTPTTIRNIVRDRVNQFLGEDMVGSITPHTFLHYFVTTILRTTGNLKLAQVLARHSNIQVTQRYAHLNDDELDKGYYDIFEKSSGQTK